ncbi:hypothetical protein [Flavobacterium sp. ABG]|uniref:hypothetical protein n=1 Tax=Flavobacterium sp. ABG TaxID=1423322 RepID=UPI000A580BBB|nr:hypothetical protein [Flavobacterium sp. ABG]
MKKYIKYSLYVLAFSAFCGCSSDDPKEDPVSVDPKPAVVPTIKLSLKADYTVERYKAVEVNPEVVIENGNGLTPQYKWTLKVTDKAGATKDSVIGDAKILHFIAPLANNYTVDFTVTVDKVVKQASTKVTVSETGKTYNSKALTLLDYLPSPHYGMDNYEFATKAEVLERVREELMEESMIPLGTFGGSISVGFDHTVINTYGKRDFTIKMNSSSTVKFTPVSVYVAYDANKNGLADDNEWYEIAGSEYRKSSTVKNYEVTYHRPNPDKVPVAGALDWQFDKEYLKWSDNKSINGFITKTARGEYNNYYPQWVGDSYTVKGTKVSLPVKDVSDGSGKAFNVGTFEWGYGGIKNPSIDISWAVDSNGNKVHLPGVDFVKVYVPTLIEIGASDLLTNFFKEVEDLNFTTGK